MATETKPATEEAKMDLFEDDDEFEEFEINEGNCFLRRSLLRFLNLGTPRLWFERFRA